MVPSGPPLQRGIKVHVVGPARQCTGRRLQAHQRLHDSLRPDCPAHLCRLPKWCYHKQVLVLHLQEDPIGVCGSDYGFSLMNAMVTRPCVTWRYAGPALGADFSNLCMARLRHTCSGLAATDVLEVPAAARGARLSACAALLAGIQCKLHPAVAVRSCTIVHQCKEAGPFTAIDSQACTHRMRAIAGGGTGGRIEERVARRAPGDLAQRDLLLPGMHQESLAHLVVLSTEQIQPDARLLLLPA